MREQPVSMQKFMREGATSRQEQKAEFSAVDFDTKLATLRKEDLESIKESPFGSAVENLLRVYELKNISPEVCATFLSHRSEFHEYHPALVLAIAEIINEENEKKTPDILH